MSISLKPPFHLFAPWSVGCCGCGGAGPASGLSAVARLSGRVAWCGRLCSTGVCWCVWPLVAAAASSPVASAAGASSCLGLSWVARGVPRQQVSVEQLGKVGGGGCLLGVRRLGAAGAGVCSHACPPMLVGSSRKHSGPLILIVFFSEPDILGHFPPRLFLEFVPAPLLKRRLNCCFKAFPPHALVSVPFVVGLGLGGAAGSSPRAAFLKFLPWLWCGASGCCGCGWLLCVGRPLPLPGPLACCRHCCRWALVCWRRLGRRVW